MSLENKTAVVTGGSRGIGEAVALKLASQGANIAIVYVGDESEGKAAKEKVEALGVKTELYYCDVSNFEESKATVEKIIDAIRDRTFAIKQWVKDILDDDKKRENVNSVKESMIGRLNELASGEGLKESASTESERQMNEKVQEIAEEMVTRRRRGR